MRRTVRLLSALALAGLMLATSARSTRAGMITDTATFGSAANPLTVPFNSTLTLAQFDTTMGTLTSVQFVLNQSATLTASVGNFSGNTALYSQVFGTSAVTVSGAGLTTTATSAIGPFAGTDTTSGVFTQVGTGTSGSSSNAFVSPSTFASYEGVGMGTYTDSI